MTNRESYNHLKSENSSYLLQHKENPVHWFPYSEEALLKAKEEDKPLFISIGYSSCHWCHVMNEESFQDQEIAKIMNENFINIKIDREEYPDIDQYYQHACQAIMGRGGWPLSVFTTPDMKAFYVGTYFPKNSREGMPSFKEVLEKISQAYREDKENVTKNANEILEIVTREPRVDDKVEFTGHFPAPVQIITAIDEYIDKENGGFGDNPKFPNFSFYEFIIEQALEGMLPPEMVELHLAGLEKMMMGGIYDHVRGGFHRYSVDKKWEVPHFEKMLYDQSGMLRVLAKATLIMPSPLFFDAIIQTMDYIESEMLTEEGYFLSAQDADSEGKEGLYFTFTKEEFEAAVMNHELKLEERLDTFYEWFNITEEGNFKNKLNTITLNYSKKEEFFSPEGWNEVREIKTALNEERKTRIPPMTDSKGIASWNFMLLSSLIDVFQYTKIDIIKHKSSSLINKSVEGIHKAFVQMTQTESGEKAQVRHTTTLEKTLPYFEDYVSLCEMSLRLYEFSANNDFLDNLEKTIDFVFKEFVKDGKFYTRGVSFDENERYENLTVPLHDQSFKAPLATFVGLVRKTALLWPDKEYVSKITEIMELMTHTVLKNPLAGGESLRSLIYPHDVYRKVQIPRAFLKEDKFLMFLPFFSVRFLLDYTDEKTKWQVCTIKECEFQGDGVEEFFETFSKHNQSTDSE